MNITQWSTRAAATASVLLLLAAPHAFAADDAPVDTASELKALKARISELEQKENSNWLTDERAAQIKSIVQGVIADSKARGQITDAPTVGYKDGFFLQTPDQNFKLLITGYTQVRYEYAYANVNTHDTTIKGNTVTHDPGNSSGFDIRRARVAFSGNAFSPDITFKLEGDFYGGGNPAVNSASNGSNSLSNGTASTSFFTVTDAFVGYRVNDQIKFKAGSYKVPFAKSELTADPYGTFAERAEVLAPFDPVRSLGVSMYGDLKKDVLSYEVAINDGGNSNTLRSDDTIGTAPNIDNRMAYYARMQWAGSGKISDFADEADLRADNRQFIWLLGGAAGYESQTSVNDAFPSPQGSTTINGVTTGGNFSNYTLNGSVYRGTLDWSAKWQGASFLAAAYFQQVNAEPTGTTSSPVLPAPGNSFFEHGYYGQAGYFILPRKLELVGRGGVLLTEGASRNAEYFSAGANYYLYGQNVKVQSDVTYTPQSAFSSPSGSLLANTQDLIFRVQLQLKF